MRIALTLHCFHWRYPCTVEWLRSKGIMKDLKLEKVILSSKRRKHEVVKQLWERVMQCTDYWRRRRVIIGVRRECKVLCALQLQWEGIVGECKAPVRIKWLSVSGLQSGKSVVALWWNCIDSFCMQYERSGCVSLHRDYDGSGMEHSEAVLRHRFWKNHGQLERWPGNWMFGNVACGPIVLIVFKMYKITLELVAVKITDYIKKCFKWKLLRIRFPTKKLNGCHRPYNK